MVDRLTPEQRRLNMSRIRSKNTKPEMAVRSIVYAAGYRYRVHGRGLPGTPDLVFSSRRKVIFVHGCFWHSHDCPKGRVVPVTNADFWVEKRAKAVRRDLEALAALSERGWQSLIIWECQTRDSNEVVDCVRRFLDGS